MVKTFISATRLPGYTPNGHPRYLVAFGDGSTARTVPSAAYYVSGFRNGDRVKVFFNKRDCLTGIRKVSESPVRLCATCADSWTNEGVYPANIERGELVWDGLPADFTGQSCDACPDGLPADLYTYSLES